MIILNKDRQIIKVKKIPIKELEILRYKKIMIKNMMYKQ